MSGGMHTVRTRTAVPAIGPWVPTATLHLVFLGVGIGLCLLVLKDPFWLGAGLLIAFFGTFTPSFVPKWCLVLLLGLSQFWREPLVTDVAFYLLLAGVHLLHVIGSLARQMPWHGRMQRGALVRPLQQFVCVQVVVQTVAVGALLAFGGGRGTVPGLSIFSASVLGLIAVVLVRGRRGALGRD